MSIRIISALILALVVTGAAMAQSVRAELDAVIVRDAGGATVGLGELVEEPTILHFWATWCAPCRDELPEIETFIEGLEDAGRLVLVSVDTSGFERIEEFLADLGVRLESRQQVEGNVGSVFGFLGYPSTVVVDAEGEVLWRRQGVVAWAEGDGQAVRELVGE